MKASFETSRNFALLAALMAGAGVAKAQQQGCPVPNSPIPVNSTQNENCPEWTPFSGPGSIPAYTTAANNPILASIYIDGGKKPKKVHVADVRACFAAGRSAMTGSRTNTVTICEAEHHAVIGQQECARAGNTANQTCRVSLARPATPPEAKKPD